MPREQREGPEGQGLQQLQELQELRVSLLAMHFLAFSRILVVMLPVPGPISSTVSVGFNWPDQHRPSSTVDVLLRRSLPRLLRHCNGESRVNT